MSVFKTSVELVEPELFPPGSLDERPDIVEAVKEGPAVYSGKIVGKDLELVRGVVADVLKGVSDRKIAAKWHVSRNTIVRCEMILRERGELEPLAKRVGDDLTEILLLLGSDIKSDILAGRIHPNSKGLLYCQIFDKKVAHAAGVVPGTGRTISELRAADVRVELEAQLRQLQDSPDLESGAVSLKGQQIDVETQDSTGLSTVESTTAGNVPNAGGGDVGTAAGPDTGSIPPKIFNS